MSIYSSVVGAALQYDLGNTIALRFTTEAVKQFIAATCYIFIVVACCCRVCYVCRRVCELVVFEVNK